MNKNYWDWMDHIIFLVIFLVWDEKSIVSQTLRSFYNENV